MEAEALAQPKKPPSSYFLFSKDTRTGTKMTPGECAAEWKSLAKERRCEYEARAEQMKAKYIEQMEAFHRAGGTSKPRARRGDGKKGKQAKAEKEARGCKKDEDQGRKNNEEQGGMLLKELPHSKFLREFGRRLAEPEFAQLYAQRLAEPLEAFASEPPKAKRRKAGKKEPTTAEIDFQDSHESGSKGHVAEAPKCSASEMEEEAAPLKEEPQEKASGSEDPSSRQIQQAMIAADVGDDMAKGFKRWLTCRWEKFTMDLGTKKAKQIGVLASQKWDRMSEQKKATWCTENAVVGAMEDVLGWKV